MRPTFGDVSTGLVLEVAKQCVAVLGTDIDPLAAQQLQDNSYVDDSVLGGDEDDATLMRGERVNGEYTGTVVKILAKGAMTVKFITVSGSKDPWEEEQLGGKNLGVNYCLKEDEIFFQLKPAILLRSCSPALMSSGK